MMANRQDAVKVKQVLKTALCKVVVLVLKTELLRTETPCSVVTA